jgi:hypothetical protein
MKLPPLGNKNITGNGELPNMNITNGEQRKHKRNANSSSRYNCYESWDAELRNDIYYSEDEGKEEIEAEIVPIKTKKVNDLATDCNADIDKFLLSRESSSSPPKQFQLQKHRNEDDHHYATTESSGEIKLQTILFRVA